MECELFRRITNAPFEQSARGERSACLIHLDTCAACLKWFLSSARKVHNMPMEEALAIMKADEQDEEFCR